MPIDRRKVPSRLAAFLGNRQVVDILRRAIEQDRLPHALIFAGPAGVGKCTLAILLAQELNCVAPTTEGACCRCLACRKIQAVLKARHLACSSPKGELACGGCPNCRILSGQHPDIRLIGPAPDKTTISIDQVRDLITEISYQPFEARFRVVILDPAEQMKNEAHNSLLKTLEEPASRTFIILVTANPYLLLWTIRSRSRMLQFGGIPQHQIEEYLSREEGRTHEEARLAAIFSHGSLGAALAFDTTQYREVRKRALDFVSLLLNRGRFAEASQLAATVSKDKESFPVWLESVEAVLQDIYFAQIAPSRIRQRDLTRDLAALAQAASRAGVVSAINAVKRMRIALARNVNRQVAVESLFLTAQPNG